MSKNLFNYPEQIPVYLKEVPMYRATKYKTYSRREADVQKDLDLRAERYTKFLSIKATPEDLGEVIVYQYNDQELEIFRPSDSLRFTHKGLSSQAATPKAVKLPDEKKAFDVAANYLDKYELTNENATIKALAYTEFVSHAMKKGDVAPQVIKTEAHVIYSFSLDGIPVMGPGAKIKISMVENEKMSGLLYFWRNTTKEKAMKITHPIEALRKLTNSPNFMKLSPETASVDLHSIQFGYYAMPPGEFQRFLIPVYAVKGTVKTEFFDRDDFTRYVVAVDLSPEEIKKLGVVANPDSCTMF